MIQQIYILHEETSYRLVDGAFQCDHINTQTELHKEYNPSQQQLSEGLDFDVEFEAEICLDCGQDVTYG